MLKEKIKVKEIWIYISLFLSAFIIRIINLGKIFTIDDIIWINFYQQFMKAVFNGDFAYTYLHSHPGVISMWLSGLFLKANELIFPFGYTIPGDISSPANAVNLFYTFYNSGKIGFYSYLPQILVVCFSIVLIYYLLKRVLNNKTIALIAGFLIAFSPSFIGYNTQYLNQDTYLACFITISILFLLLCLKENKTKFAILSGIFFSLALLSKITGIVFGVGIIFIILINTFSEKDKKQRKKYFKSILIWLIVAGLVYFILWPALWVSPLNVFERTKDSLFALGGDFKHLTLFFGQVKQMNDIPGLLFYITILTLKLSPIELIFFIISLFVIFTKKRFLKELEYPFLIFFFIFIYIAALSLGTVK